jgi:catechol 2,3-dioxygenase-like lactoylglutathione lyase family enzyme
MTTPNAVHHVAISTADMKSQIAFFSDVLGMSLQGLFWMHGAPNAWHAFLAMGEASFSFVFIPGNEEKETVIGQTHAGTGAGSSAPGTMQHIAFNVDTLEDLLNMRDRIRSRGVPVFGPLDHGLCHSIYFAGPENLTLEVATSDQVTHPLDSSGTWIDQDVVNLAGISPEELDSYLRPAQFEGQNGALTQPEFDADKPHLHYPKDAYPIMLEMPDSQFKTRQQDREPPSPKASK